MRGYVNLPNVLKYPGSKRRLANWICDFIPNHHSYLEPFFGSGAVFFAKEPSNIETINDLDCRVTNLFKIIRDCPEELAKIIASTPYSRWEYSATFGAIETGNLLESSRLFLIQCWQGHGFRTSRYSSGWKNDVQGRGSSYALQNWYRLPGWILEVAERLRQVQIENMPAVDLIERFRYPNVFIYADPPYVLSTRTGMQYKYEMTDEDHVDLLQTLDAHPGPVLLSGYESDLYGDMLSHWYREEIAGYCEKGLTRKEVLWINPFCAKALHGGLFGDDS